MARRRDRDYGLPQIREKRPRARRRCLRCNRSFSTVIDQRICKRCAAVNEALQVGELTTATTVFVVVHAWD